MGRMKEIYINIINEYGEMPDGFSLTEYLHEKKNNEEQSWRCQDDEKSSGREETSQSNDSMDANK
jgi:hypothetical protein